MTDPTEKFSRDVQGIALSPAEHAAVRSAVVAFMRATPQRPPVTAFVLRHAAALSFATFVLLAGATTTLAQQALPGDFLYPVRLAVNDRLSVALAGDEIDQMDREVDQMERMLDEEELVASDELASLALEGGADVSIESDGTASVDADAQIDIDADAEIRSLEQMLEQEESAAELELSF